VAHSGVLYIFFRDSGLSNVAGPGVTYPLPHPRDGPDGKITSVTNCSG